MRTFNLVRQKDISGVSGTGKVAEGVVFTDGWVALRWLSATPSTDLYRSIEEVLTVHGHGDATHVEFLS